MIKQEQLNLPPGWSICQLSDLVGRNGIFSDGDWIETKDQDPSGAVRLVQLADIGQMHFLDKSRRFLTLEKSKTLNCTYLRHGDVLISRLGDPLGKACVYPGIDPHAVTAVDVCIFRPGESPINPTLIAHFLNSMGARAEIDTHASGTTRKRITGKKLKSVQIPLAPLNEQSRIVDKIEALFSQLDKGEEAIRTVKALLKRYRQSVLKAAVTGELTADWRAENAGKLEHGRDLLAHILKTRRETWSGRGKYKEPVEPDTSDLPELPEGWVWTSVDHLAMVFGGLTKNAKRRALPTKRPMLRVANVYQNCLDLTDVHEIGLTANEIERVQLQIHDLLVVEGNGSKDQIGRMAIWRNEIPNAVHQNHLIKIRLFEHELSQFILNWFQSPNGRVAVEAVASSTSGLHTLSISKIASLPVPLPCLAEAKIIVEHIEDAFGRIVHLESACERELMRTTSLRQSILKDAFTGLLVEQDPTDEPAANLLARIKAARADAPKKTRGRPRRQAMT